MMKRCHKCQKVYDTDDFFCKNCGGILYDEPQGEKEKTEEPTEEHTEETNKSENGAARGEMPQKPAADVPDTEDVPDEPELENESRVIMQQVDILCKYITGGTFRSCTFIVILSVVFSSVVEAFMQFGAATMQFGKKLPVYEASNIALFIALTAFYTLMPAISMYKLSADADKRAVATNSADGAFVYSAGKSLGYITAFYTVQTVISCGLVGLILNAAFMSAVSGEGSIAAVLFGAGIIIAAVILPYVISGLVAFSSARTCFRCAVPLKVRGGKLFGIYFMIISILTTVILAAMLVFVGAVKASGVSIPLYGEIRQILSKMGGAYGAYVMLMLMRSIVDIVIASGFLGFLEKIKKVK